MVDQISAIDFSGITHALRSTAVALINMQRENMMQPLDYVEFVLPSSMDALPEFRNLIQQRLWGKPPLSLLELERAFDRIAHHEDIKGVILYIRGFAMPLADLQTLRDSIQRLRSRGKRVVAFALDYGMAEYYVASACDEILLQPGGELRTTGLFQQQVFLKEGLEAIGLKADVVQITPFKGAADSLSRSEPSREGEQQINWLLDSNYDMLLNGMAQGRNLTVEQVRAMIDDAPMMDKAALQAGYVDGLVNEEGLQKHLGSDDIQLWEQADGMLPLKMPRPTNDYVALIRAAGLIVPGESANPPIDIPLPIVGGERMGDITIVRQVRNLMQDDECKAVVLYIDSGGGSATASEAMASALNELAKKKPLVVFMGAIAASGGYYMATAADHIIAQPGTITGSIGVLNMKLVNTEALRKLKFNPYTFERGKNAAIYASIAPFTEEQRGKMQHSIERIYEQFVGRVADARKMKVDAIDKIAGGRVWTGQQALEHGLVDELGGLHEALNKARQMAQIPLDSPIGIVRGAGKPLPAQLAEQLDPAAAIRYWHEGLSYVASGHHLMLMPFEWRW